MKDGECCTVCRKLIEGFDLPFTPVPKTVVDVDTDRVRSPSHL